MGKIKKLSELSEKDSLCALYTLQLVVSILHTTRSSSMTFCLTALQKLKCISLKYASSTLW